MNIQVNAIVQDYQMPVDWAEVLIDVEASAIYRPAGTVPAYAAGGYTADAMEYELEDVDIWSSDGTKFFWDMLPGDLKKEITRQFEADKEMQ